MQTVFLSYSIKDHYFAELAQIKLREADIRLWRDHGQLRAGHDWRQGIEQGISECIAVLVALSTNSSDSTYVTFEWAYALGKGKAVIPVKLTDCQVHPRLEAVQHLDFSIPGTLPWASLIERIREIEPDGELVDEASSTQALASSFTPDDLLVRAILAYLNQRGYQMASFDRLRRRIDESLTDQQFLDMIERNPTTFRSARLADGRLGIAKRIP